MRGGWIVPASDDDPDRTPVAELRVRPFAEAVARRVGKRAIWRPAMHSVHFDLFPSSACRCGADGPVSGPTGRPAWQCQKRRCAHVGLISPLVATQPLDLRMQPVSSLRKFGARFNAHAGRLRSGHRSESDREISNGDREEQHARRCTKRKPGRTYVARPSSEPAAYTIHGSAAASTYRAYDIPVCMCVCSRITFSQVQVNI